MSQENVEIVRAAFAAWNAGDTDTLREAIDPNVMVWPAEGWPEPGPFLGREAVLRWFEQIREAWDTDAMAPITFTDAGDRVLVRVLWHGAGQGPESNMEFTVIYMLRKGMIVYQEHFWDHAEALEAVGLSEQDAHADS